ncbi:hypothetical protein ABG067_001249 [Albugo candida]
MKASAHDEDFGQTQTLLYSVVSGDPLGHFSINVDTGLISVAGQLDINSINIYKLVIKVVDSDGLYALSKPSFDVVILDYPDPPYFADAVFNQKNYQINITQLLFGTKSYSTIRLHVVDPDVDQTGGKCSISQDVASSFELQAQVDPTLCVLVVRPTVTIKVNTCYNVTVKVTDFLSSGTDQMYSEITLEVALFGAYYPPECFDMSFSLLENSPTGSWIGNVIAVDGLGGNAVEYSVFNGNEYDMFRISKSTGDLSVGTNTSDFETATKFILEIEVRDDTVVPLIGTCTATIWILNEIESPQCDQTADFNVPEDAVIEIPVGEALWNHCRDEDSGKRGSSNFFLFEFARTMTADIPFTISNSSGQISVMSNLNYEAKSYYPNLTVVVRNAKSSLHFTYMSVSIMVDDRNDPPEAKFLTAEGTSELTSVIVPENLGIGTVIAQLVLYDEDINETLDASLSTTTTTFRLDHINATTHYILLGGFVDHEMREFYNISIVAWDHEGALKKSSLDIIIADVNEKPWILPNQHFFIEESAKAGQLIQTLFNQRGACDLTTTAIALVSHCNSLPSCMSACASRSECFGGVYQTEKAICRLTDRILQDGAGCTVPCADCEMFERLLPTAPGELIQQDSYLTNDAPLKAALISMHSLSIKMPFHPYTLMHLESWPLLSKFTVDGWINLQQNEGSLLTLYLKQTNRSEKLLFLQWIYSADTLQITLGSASLDTRYRMDKSVWYHIATTFSSDTGMLNIYIDGSRVIQQNLPTSVVLPLFGVPLNPEVIIFGTCFDELMCPSKPFSFWIDEVRCWSEEKTHEFLRNVYNKVITYPDASLISYHRFESDELVRRNYSHYIIPNVSSSSSVSSLLVDGAPTNVVSFAAVDHIVADDDDTGNSGLIYSFADGTADDIVRILEIQPYTGAIRLRKDASLDYERQSQYAFQVTVQDPSNLTSNPSLVTLSVVDEDELPVISNTSVFTIAENTQVGQFVGFLGASHVQNGNLFYNITGGNENGIFVLANGSLWVAKARLDYEVTATYQLTILVSKSKMDTKYATMTLTVLVQDVNEPPIIAQLHAKCTNL